MSTWKIGKKTESEPAAGDAVRVVDARKRAPAPQVDVLSLELDIDDDVGGDPYNSTGQFCVPDFDARDD